MSTTPDTKLTVETCASAYRTDSLLSFHNANREVLRITHDGHMITGEGLSKEEATQEAAKLLIASFEEQIQKMVDARVTAELVTMYVPRREKAEADTARLDWLQSSINLHVNSIALRGDIRDAIDKTMKEASK
jgi:Glu-tRNA(Gln) amidotransferase subunit E-like FAD-binding protein